MPALPEEHIIYVDICIYLKKKERKEKETETENRSSAPRNKSLQDVGVRRDSEKEVLEKHHILLQSH